MTRGRGAATTCCSTGLARIGGNDAARVAEPYVRRLWFTPHTFERPSVLRAGLAFAHDRLDLRLKEGLRDCEERVRLIAVEHVQVDDSTRQQLRYLAGGPFEAATVRAAATARLHSDT
ncbi:hypothetical protein [Actinoplanes sp. NPDC051859]|uniref:hypothetical protein n=1 Tax=Actinoplanes sp. NPDC051859 TaxID=3363909 RepID=UPI0037BDEC22